MTRVAALENIKRLVNEAGSQSYPMYRFVKEVQPDEYGHRIIEIKNKKTKEVILAQLSSLLSGANPWTQLGFSDEEVLSRVNDIGQNADPKFKFVKMAESDGVHRNIELQNIETKETLTRRLSNILNGQNPWGKTKYTRGLIKEKVDKIGLTARRPFRFVKDTGERSSTNDRLIKIQFIGSRDTEIRQLNNILKIKPSKPISQKRGRK